MVYVMTTFPILLGSSAARANPLPVLTFAYAAGYCGILLSPVQSCLVMSAAYFKSDIFRPIRRMLAPCGIVLATGAVLFFVLRRVTL